MFAVPNLRHLRAFEAVARLGSVGRASIHIHVSQPAVTQAVAKLEAQVGAQLFDRRSSGSYPTEIGLILLRRVDRFFAMLEEALSAVDQRDLDRAEPSASPLNTITSTQLRALVATANPATVSEHAQLIGVSETTLYRSARELELNLGCRLYRPAASGVTSTPLGAQLARKVGLAIRELEYAFEEIEVVKGQAATRLSIGVLPMSGSFALAAAVSTLTTRHPSSSVSIIEGSYVSLLQQLRDGSIDIILGLLRRPDWADDIVEERLFDDSFCIVVRAAHPLAAEPEITAEKLARYSWVVPPPGTPRRRAIDTLFAGLDQPVSFGVETSSTQVIRALVANSDRISVLSRHEVEFEERVRLFKILPLEMGDATPKGLTFRANWLPTSLHEEFIDLLRLHTEEASRPAETTAPPQPPLRLVQVAGT